MCVFYITVYYSTTTKGGVRCGGHEICWEPVQGVGDVVAQIEANTGEWSWICWNTVGYSYDSIRSRAEIKVCTYIKYIWLATMSKTIYKFMPVMLSDMVNEYCL